MNLKELREKNKLTQAAFGSSLGVSGKAIYLIESGNMNDVALLDVLISTKPNPAHPASVKTVRETPFHPFGAGPHQRLPLA